MLLLFVLGIELVNADRTHARVCLGHRWPAFPSSSAGVSDQPRRTPDSPPQIALTPC